MIVPKFPLQNVLFGVNVIENSNLHHGLNGWSPVGSCTLRICSDSPYALPNIAKDSILHHQLLSGRYILAGHRTETWMGPSQEITDKLKLHFTYQVAALVCLGSGANGPQIINVTLHVDDQWISGGQVRATDDRWYEVRGGFRLEKQLSKAVVYVSGPPAGVDLMVTGLHISPVDTKARFAYLKEKTNTVLKLYFEMNIV